MAVNMATLQARVHTSTTCGEPWPLVDSSTPDQRTRRLSPARRVTSTSVIAQIAG